MILPLTPILVRAFEHDFALSVSFLHFASRASFSRVPITNEPRTLLPQTLFARLDTQELLGDPLEVIMHKKNKPDSTLRSFSLATPFLHHIATAVLLTSEANKFNRVRCVTSFVLQDSQKEQTRQVRLRVPRALGLWLIR